LRQPLITNVRTKMSRIAAPSAARRRTPGCWSALPADGRRPLGPPGLPPPGRERRGRSSEPSREGREVRDDARERPERRDGSGRSSTVSRSANGSSVDMTYCSRIPIGCALTSLTDRSHPGSGRGGTRTPTLLRAQKPESCVSTNSTTRPMLLPSRTFYRTRGLGAIS
jgi:hypothetical protein